MKFVSGNVFIYPASRLSLCSDESNSPIDTAGMNGDNIVIADEQGNEATVTIADVRQSNGVIHVIDTVRLPAS